MKLSHLFIINGAVFGEMFVSTARPAQQNNDWLLCSAPVFLCQDRNNDVSKQQGLAVCTMSATFLLKLSNLTYLN